MIWFLQFGSRPFPQPQTIVKNLQFMYHHQNSLKIHRRLEDRELERGETLSD